MTPAAERLLEARLNAAGRPLGRLWCLRFQVLRLFTSYAQCQATASGLAAECYGKTIRDDEMASGENATSPPNSW